MYDFSTFSIRIPTYLHRRLKVAADRNFRTLNQEVGYRLARSFGYNLPDEPQSLDSESADSAERPAPVLDAVEAEA